MSDNLKAKGQDAKRVNINEQWELNYWTKTLGVSADKLKHAVQKVGPMVTDVRKFLGA